MAKTQALAGYKIVGTTSDGVRILKPKMAPSSLLNVRAMVARMKAVDIERAATPPKRKTAGKRPPAKSSSRTK